MHFKVLKVKPNLPVQVGDMLTLSEAAQLLELNVATMAQRCRMASEVSNAERSVVLEIIDEDEDDDD